MLAKRASTKNRIEENTVRRKSLEPASSQPYSKNRFIAQSKKRSKESLPRGLTLLSAIVAVPVASRLRCVMPQLRSRLRCVMPPLHSRLRRSGTPPLFLATRTERKGSRGSGKRTKDGVGTRE
ncbi:unnamed protein product [Linum trigynum]|uniref:Uncharacterized protein n=1 Tax=Linum trigynum TaxID=586398 RepID=A0AAV2CZY4_9ROSI